MTPAGTALAIVLPPEKLDDALQVFDEEQAQLFADTAIHVQEIAAKIPTGKVESDDQAREIHSLLTLAKDATAAVEDARKRTVGPLNNQVKAINDLYRPLTSALDNVKAKSEPLVLAWLQAKRAAQQKAEAESRQKILEAQQREVEARVAAENAKTPAERQDQLALAGSAMQDAVMAEILAPPPIKGIASTVGSHSITRRWVATVTDVSKLPREYLMPDQRAIDDALAAAMRKARAEERDSPDLEIPGVTIQEVEGLRKGRGV